MRKVLVLLIAFLLVSCSPSEAQVQTAIAQIEGSFITNTHTPTNTFTPSPTLTSTPASTPTLPPNCYPGNIIQGTANKDLPGYMDILSVSTTLNGNVFSVEFTLAEIPDEIIINREDTQEGWPEIAWAVAIDVDNAPNTGAPTVGRGYGYDKKLQAFHFRKPGEEQTGGIQNLFRRKTSVWEIYRGGSRGLNNNGTISVDKDAKTITLRATIPGMMNDSYLYFYTFDGVVLDELCGR
jgi:hypothetical protein